MMQKSLVKWTRKGRVSWGWLNNSGTGGPCGIPTAWESCDFQQLGGFMGKKQGPFWYKDHLPKYGNFQVRWHLCIESGPKSYLGSASQCFSAKLQYLHFWHTHGIPQSCTKVPVCNAFSASFVYDRIIFLLYMISFYTPASTKLKGSYTGFTSSVRLSVDRILSAL